MRREAQVRRPSEAAINRTLVIDLRLSVAVVIPDHMNAPGGVGRDASGEVEAEQRIARIVRQATILPPVCASRRRMLKLWTPIGKNRARFDALRRLIETIICWRNEVWPGLLRARFGRNAISANDEGSN